MSEENSEQVTGAEQTARKMVSVNGKELGANKKFENSLKFIKCNKLTPENANTIIAAGIYTGKRTYSFDGGETREDLIILDPAAKVEVSLSQNTTLRNQFSKVPEGTYVEVTYLGSEVMTKGLGKGKITHKFVVGREA